MTLRTALTTALLLLIATTLLAHDLFIKPESFFVAPQSSVAVRILNGTFTSSENSIEPDRVADLSLVTPDGRMHPGFENWDDKSDTTRLRLTVGSAGTYVLGLSTKPRAFTLDAKDFNQYLADDGVPDILAARKEDGTLQQPARERYSKHVRAILQVGEERSALFATRLGYPAEIVPLDNPYGLNVGGTLRVLALVDGAPVANQYILAGGRTPTGDRLARQAFRSDSAGVGRVRITHAGQWYVKFIHMEPMTGDSVDYESKWATMTFGVK